FEAPDRLRLVRSDPPGDRARAPEAGGVEAARLLLAERRRLERAPRPAELLAQGAQRDEARDHAEGAVVAAARRLRVDVRAGGDHRTGLHPLEPAPDRADGVA